MSIEEEASALLRVPPFKPVPANRLKLLAFASQLVTEHAGTVIITQDRPGESAYVLLEGTVRVEIDIEGSTQSFGELEPYAFFGEIAVIRNSPRAATITAVSDVTLLKISKIALHNLMNIEPDLAGRIEQHIDSRGYKF